MYVKIILTLRSEDAQLQLGIVHALISILALVHYSVVRRNVTTLQHVLGE